MPEFTVDGSDFFAIGQDSYTQPQRLTNGEFVLGVNLMVRGGLAQTRPGSRTLLTVPDGNFQGFTVFTPANGIPQLVFAVDGYVYVSPQPFTSYRRLPNIRFGLTSRFISWANCLKSTDFNSEGVLYYLDSPYSVLMMQDGNTRAAYWDGSNSGHMDPMPSDSDVTQPGKDGTKVGLWMIWSNNRLWVSRGNQIFASDIGNPMKFTESQYLNEGRAFYLPGVCTGIVETPDQQGIIAFTESTGTFLQSSIQDRTQWLQTPAFQKTVLPNIGCISARSIVHQYGMIWWYSSRGLMNLDSALQLNITSRMDIRDNEMFSTKYNLSYDLSGICGSFYENLVLMSVPNGDKYNTQTMVLDQAPFEGAANAWCGYWSGWRPIEWGGGTLSGSQRLFFGSVDYDGKNRIWEAMTSDKMDNGVPITCALVTRAHMFESADFKKFYYCEIDLEEIVGDVSIMAAVAGRRGGFQPALVKEIISTKGQVYADSDYGFGGHIIAGSRPQTRVVKTQEMSDASECNSACVESTILGLIDKSFQMMIVWSGVAGISRYRIFTQPWTNTYNGECETNEDSDRILNEDGCGALSEFSTTQPFTTYSSTYTASSPDGSGTMTYTATQYSSISQDDADRKARLAAEAYVAAQLGQF